MSICTSVGSGSLRVMEAGASGLVADWAAKALVDTGSDPLVFD
jgi:hypothetical protein